MPRALAARSAGEGGISYPKAESLKRFIALCVKRQAFAAGREEEEIRALWQAAHQKVVEAEVETDDVCVDPQLQWSQARNIWHNSAVRTMMYKMSAPVRWIRGRSRG